MFIQKPTMFASDNQGDKDPDETAGNPSIEEIADEEFEEIEGDEEPGSDDDDSGDQEEDSGDESEEQQAPKRKWAGEFNSPEEMEAAFIRNLKEPKTETQEPPAGIPDLTDAELNTMSEQDTQDGTQFMEEYLRRKMMERNLAKHELVAARAIDAEKGTDLLGDYHELRAVRAVRKETAPLARKSQQESQAAFAQREQSIDSSNTKEFGESLTDLENFVSKPKNVEAVLQQSPIAHLIISEHERGSPATAHKLLLREAQAYSRMSRESAKASKSRMSVRADAGGQTITKQSKNSAATIEEAFEMAENEQDQE